MVDRYMPFKRGDSRACNGNCSLMLHDKQNLLDGASVGYTSIEKE